MLKITHKDTKGARVSFYRSLGVLGEMEAGLDRLNRVQTPGLGFKSRQGLLAESLGPTRRVDRVDPASSPASTRRVSPSTRRVQG